MTPRFVKLTDGAGMPHYVNADDISEIMEAPTDMGQFGSGLVVSTRKIFVRETSDKVLELLATL